LGYRSVSGVNGLFNLLGIGLSVMPNDIIGIGGVSVGNGFRGVHPVTVNIKGVLF
jgi:hypothetical protein